MAINTRALVRRVLRSAASLGLFATLAVAPTSNLAAQEEVVDGRTLFNRIEWVFGEKEVDIGNVAEFMVPAGCRYTDVAGARTFLLLTQNPPNGREQGLLLCGDIVTDTSSSASATGQKPWFVVFSFDASGYVRDDDKKELDAARILAAIRAGTAAANELRKQEGWEVLTIDGWVRPPYYDSATHNLTWSTKASTPSDGASVNHSVRLLGRRGVLHADLVSDPEQLDAIVGTFDGVIGSTKFLPGHKYSEWRKGDKVAAYGLTALVAGGAGVAASKLGLFGKIGKFFVLLFAKMGKLLIAAVFGVAAGIKALFRKKREATA
jgi:uncharacterized membrane-anchored protein